MDEIEPPEPPEREPKDQRIPIMMSASDVKAIDDWAFANRIRSRAEAIRRLTRRGLLLQRVIQLMGATALSLRDSAEKKRGSVTDVQDQSYRLFAEMVIVAANAREAGDPDDVLEMFVKNIRQEDWDKVEEHLFSKERKSK